MPIARTAPVAAPPKSQGAPAPRLDHDFNREVFERLPNKAELTSILVGRMDEAQRCFDAGAHLAATIIYGSVLEGVCLGFGYTFQDLVSRAFSECYPDTEKFPPLPTWKLHEWIEVLGSLGYLTPNVETYAEGLRDFRNYVHPNEQLKAGFTPDRNSARMARYVTLIAADDLLAATTKAKSGTRMRPPKPDRGAAKPAPAPVPRTIAVAPKEERELSDVEKYVLKTCAVHPSGTFMTFKKGDYGGFSEEEFEFGTEDLRDKGFAEISATFTSLTVKLTKEGYRLAWQLFPETRRKKG